MVSNSSKPYQLQEIARKSFGVPDTVVTNDPARAMQFIEQYPKVICKSISSSRSTVFQLSPPLLDDLDRIRWCPVQFQEFVEGRDVRVHVVGADVISTEIFSNETDYRYDGAAWMVPAMVDSDVEESCQRLTESLGLEFAGIDLRIAPDGRVYCFEVNPSPAYSYYEVRSGQPISAGLARLLSRETV